MSSIRYFIYEYGFVSAVFLIVAMSFVVLQIGNYSGNLTIQVVAITFLVPSIAVSVVVLGAWALFGLLSLRR